MVLGDSFRAWDWWRSQALGDGTPDPPPTLDNRGASLRTSGEVLGGLNDFICKGLSPPALTLSRATPRGRLSCRCSAVHASLNRGLSSHLPKRSGEAQEWWGWGRGNWKENNGPHSSSGAAHLPCAPG